MHQGFNESIVKSRCWGKRRKIYPSLIIEWVRCLCWSASFHFHSWHFDNWTQRGRGLWIGWDGELGLGWGVCVGGCSLVATVSGNKGAAYFPQIADLPELPGDTVLESWMTLIVGHPGLRPEQTGLHHALFLGWTAGPASCLSPSSLGHLVFFVSV